MGCVLVTAPMRPDCPYPLGDAERPRSCRARRNCRAGPDRGGDRVLGGACEVASGLLPGPRGRIGSSPCETRYRGVPARLGLPRLRLVPKRPEAFRPLDVIAAALI